ncbi:MAG: type II toxin-antitoxin system PemK/MazF family toxin [Pyrinomonadaceae bacterium]
MPNYSRNEIVLVRFPFSDLTKSKIRPAVVANPTHASRDLFLVSLTTKTSGLMAGEFVLSDWASAGLNVETAVKRGIFTIREDLILRSIGSLTQIDVEELARSLRFWLGM